MSQEHFYKSESFNSEIHANSRTLQSLDGATTRQGPYWPAQSANSESPWRQYFSKLNLQRDCGASLSEGFFD